MNGVINVYKPSGITSFDVVRTIKRLSRTKKVGHTGTLDPMATGVLPICIGNATKIVDYIMQNHKVYKATLKLGVTTDTYDREGKILSESELSNVTNKHIEEVIRDFIGDIEQMPPMYSALKVNGKRLYELARQGIEVERQKRKITIYDINIENIDIPYVKFTVKCSKGTYIRSLCYDIGDILKVGGAMWDLERVETGTFSIENSIALEDLNEENIESFIIPMHEALAYKPIVFSNKFEKLLLNGVTIQNPFVIKDIEENILYKVYIEERFIGIGKKTEKGFKVEKLLI
ncbi:tRNA pseudouridine(55) synthase TruB [Clostridium peptidivorans]|uniref:tRNA pseudouridine(55) synthase TruB n=1 Tax=Clostridium peptidivorans TaxID=100174 RepID=UPI000BE4401F|nr:tRNA pseudouridine(55) synthase TruB [Clostridium peptidivorans]